MSEAWAQVEAWLQCKVVWDAPADAAPHAIARRAVGAPGVRGNLVPEAHLGALAIEHGLVLCSSDGDLARFAGLRGSIRFHH